MAKKIDPYEKFRMSEEDSKNYKFPIMPEIYPKKPKRTIIQNKPDEEHWHIQEVSVSVECKVPFLIWTTEKNKKAAIGSFLKSIKGGIKFALTDELSVSKTNDYQIKKIKCLKIKTSLKETN
jgi:hypothetical protein